MANHVLKSAHDTKSDTKNPLLSLMTPDSLGALLSPSKAGGRQVTQC